MEENNTNNNDVNLWDDSPSEVIAQEAPITPEPTPEPTAEPTPEPITNTEPEPTPVAEKVVEVEKVIEKVIEKHPEFKDEYSKAIYEAILAGGEKEVEIKKYLDEKYRDYNTMSDMDTVKEKLKRDNPSWSPKDIDAEIKFKYGKTFEKVDLSEIDSDEEPQKYAEAIKHNEDIERRELLLERDGRDARYALEQLKKSIELPNIPKAEAAPEVQAPTQEEVDELNRKWEAQVNSEMAKLGDLKFKVGDEEVTYKLTDDDKATTTEFMKNFTGEELAKDLGWVDENGNENLLKIAEDRLKLKAFEKIFASSATQIKTATKKEVMAEIKNIDLTPSPQSPEVGVNAADVLWS